MNKKLELLGLIFLNDNNITNAVAYATSIIKLINRRDMGLSVSLQSQINYIKTKMKFRKMGE
ncbi:MAG: hypothetical protein ACW98D_19865 [Promethearchaeota archaeon]|jgi:hypothetical protein